MKHPAGVLMKPQMREHPPIALGAITLPAQRDLSSLAVNPSAGRAARVGGWRGGAFRKEWSVKHGFL